ncbi:prepilin peptidase [Glaciibacter psychrotolerans]|uniref:Prepilin leader peptidase/N-methyltransferase n=1 Tax=Glaciibacter psychrotolerans TaxID=670054 RepID=A0A7Z0EHF1_9MICO|nr:A24 family peptidase [Leifsonia psychrotolerans]NYJ21538.1 leader peptidase (prepilin peptidase)/N-methyltransferase [Leifsonia psychrotolerans]
MIPPGVNEASVILTVTAGVFGLLVGSFLNVVVYRVPNGMSVVSPPSTCPRCGSGIKPFDNIPVVSWLLLRGKCRNCATAISVRYPLVELGTGVAFAVVVWGLVAGGVSTSSTSGFGSTSEIGSTSGTVAGVLTVIAFLYLAAISIALAVIDLDVKRLPNAIVLPSYIVGAVLLGAAGLLGGDLDALLRAGIGLAVLGLAYLLMALAYPGGMGFGDVKLAGVLGLYLGFLGWGELIVGAFAAFVLGGLFSIGLLLTRKATRTSGIPFGPWMLAGAWVGIFFGGSLWSAYLSLLGVA